MSDAIKNLTEALKRAMLGRPKVGGFPFLAESLRAAGVTHNIWTLPACQCTYLTKLGTVINQIEPLQLGMFEVPKFNRPALVDCLRIDQAGQSTFSEFLMASWKAGVIGYEVDFIQRRVVYYGCNGEEYAEDYPEVKI